jgi:hypothetical protein
MNQRPNWKQCWTLGLTIEFDRAWNCMKLKVGRQLWMQLKAIGRTIIKLQFAKSQIKKP